MKEKFEALRKFFKTGNTFSYEFRIGQLNALKDQIKLYENDIINALKIDMHKPEYEAFITEIAIIYQELNDAIDNLDKWMKNDKTSTPIYLRPATSYVEKRPKGVVFIISPWNYPFLLTFSPLISSIAAGNCSLIKPSKKASYSHALICKILEETFESDYISPYLDNSDRVIEFIKASDFDHIFFTGSEDVGRKIATVSAGNLTPFTLELGGKSPALVDDTIDLDLAAKKITWAKFLNLGQTCIAPDYIIVKESIKDDFLDLVIKYIKEFYGNDIKTNDDYGRIITKDRVSKLGSYILESNVLFGGEIDIEDLYISPTIIEGDLKSKVMKEEIFGPIMPILTYHDNVDILDIISLNPNPLSLYIFSENTSFINYILSGVQFGGGCINDTISHIANTKLPFGGVRQSGIGKYHSEYGFYELSNLRPILHTKKNIDIDIKYPPYTKTKSNISKFFFK